MLHKYNELLANQNRKIFGQSALISLETPFYLLHESHSNAVQ